MNSTVQNATAFSDPDSSEPQYRVWFGGARGRRIGFWTIVVLVGLIQAWSHRLLIDHDAVAYLDIADYYARGSWSSAINGFYSPLYSWLLAIALYVTHASRSWESTLLHLVNFGGYLGAYASFEFFLRQLIRKEEGNIHSEDQTASLSESTWHILGLGLFFYSSLMASVSGHSGQGDPGSTPDIFVLLFVFLAAGLVLRMHSNQAHAGTYVVFGFALAFGYFAKTAMFPLSLVFLLVAGLIAFRPRQRAWAFLLAPLCFLLLAGPWVWVVSHAKGQFTFGDAGTLTYRWLVGPRANSVEWAGQTEEEEGLVHPPRRLSMNPPVYEFATPVAGTFPLWYGSSYWLTGWKFHFSRVGQVRILHESYDTYWEILTYQKEYVALLIVLVIVGGTVQYFKVFLRGWALWLPAIAGLGMYAVVRVEPRYVAAFVALLWFSLFRAVGFQKRDGVQQFVHFAVLAAVATTSLFILHGTIHDFHSILASRHSEQAEVADGIRKFGVLEGQSLATIGIPRDSYYWARLAGVRVISEIPTANVNQYWFASPDVQKKVRSLFAQTGAVAIVTDTMPAAVSYPDSGSPITVAGWVRIGDTSYFFFPLQSTTSVMNTVDNNQVSKSD